MTRCYVYGSLHPSGWTDLIYAGSQRIATVSGTEGAAPVYDVVDHVGSELATVNGGTGAQSSLDYTPYGQVLNGTNSDGFIFTGLQHDPDGLDHADMRQYTSTAGRWITSDPYSGSYDINILLPPSDRRSIFCASCRQTRCELNSFGAALSPTPRQTYSTVSKR